MLNFIQSTAKSISKAVTDEYNDLKAPPKKVRCTGKDCTVELDVPANIFDWVCSNPQCGKLNPRDANECVNCKSTKSKVVVNPTLQCPKCGTFTIVPASNASKHLQSASKSTKEFVAQTAKSAKETYNQLKSAPREFNCEHCTTLLAVPPCDPWICPRGECAHQNGDGCDYEVCASCNIKRDVKAREVMCGVCQNVTKIPSTNFENKIKLNAKELDRSVKKIYYDIAGKNYILCPRCSAPLKLKEKKEEKKEENKEENKEGKSNEMQQIEGVPSRSASSSMSEDSEEVTCEKCQERVILQLRPSAKAAPQGPNAIAKQ